MYSKMMRMTTLTPPPDYTTSTSMIHVYGIGEELNPGSDTTQCIYFTLFITLLFILFLSGLVLTVVHCLRKMKRIKARKGQQLHGHCNDLEVGHTLRVNKVPLPIQEVCQ